MIFFNFKQMRYNCVWVQEWQWHALNLQQLLGIVISWVATYYRTKQGIARQLVTELLTFAKLAGYHTMKLDTLSTMTDAIGLYRSFGFTECEPYVFNPMDNALYFELKLTSIQWKKYF